MRLKNLLKELAIATISHSLRKEQTAILIDARMSRVFTCYKISRMHPKKILKKNCMYKLLNVLRFQRRLLSY